MKKHWSRIRIQYEKMHCTELPRKYDRGQHLFLIVLIRERKFALTIANQFIISTSWWEKSNSKRKR